MLTARRDEVDIVVGPHAGAVDYIAKPFRLAELLARLAAAAGTVVTREQLMADVWDENWFGSTKTLDVHITALRRHLGEPAGGPRRITVIRGVGYRLEEP
jgi:DNA-binding response OmpR family regulator